MKFIYIVLRLIRRVMPEGLTRFLLRKGVIIKGGYESTIPKWLVDEYQLALSRFEIKINGKNILIFGYGGNFGSACALLEKGAKHITLIDLYALPNHAENLKLLQDYPSYLTQEGRFVTPNPQYISLLYGDIIDKAKEITVDIVLSSSVFEHLVDVNKITKALASCTVTGGSQVHIIDLRDHFFVFPYMMLTFSEKTWKKWLNPSSHLNRLRFRDYQKTFEKNFEKIDIQILIRNEVAFKKTLPKIKEKFLSGNIDQDAAGMISVLVSDPIRPNKHLESSPPA